MFICKNCKSIDKFELMFSPDYQGERRFAQKYNDRNEIEISVDEYPFGIALEIENKSNNTDPQKVVRKWTEILGLDIDKAYRLSWDDKYSELCKSQNVKQYNHVTFDKPMPKVIK